MATLMFYTTNFSLVYHPRRVSQRHITAWLLLQEKKKDENSCLVHAHLDLGHKASQRKKIKIINVETEFIWFYFEYFTELLIVFSPSLKNLCSNTQRKEFRFVILALVKLAE